jgi:hypothetical protein
MFGASMTFALHSCYYLFKLWKKQTVLLDIGPWIPERLSWMAYPAPFQVGDSVIVAARQEQKGTIVNGNEQGGFVVNMLDEDGSDNETGQMEFMPSKLLREDNLRQYIIYEHKGGTDVGVTSFILHSTVAMIVFDLLGVTATLAYETPISRDAVVSTIFSLGAGFYGMLGENVQPMFESIF